MYTGPVRFEEDIVPLRRVALYHGLDRRAVALELLDESWNVGDERVIGGPLVLAQLDEDLRLERADDGRNRLV